MMYVKGREIRSDEESPMEAFIYLVCASVTLRILIGMFFYRSNYFIPFINMSLSIWSGWILFSLLAMINAIYYVFILKIERTIINSIKYAIIPPFLSALLFYAQTYIRQVVIIAILIAAVSIFPVIQYFSRLRTAKRKGKKLRKLKCYRKYTRESYKYVADIGIITMVIFLIAFFFVPSFDGKRAVVSSIKAETYDVDSESIYDLLEKSKEDLLVLQEGRWEEAPVDERINGLQALLNCEISYFKLSEGVLLKSKEMGEYQAGYYSAEERTAYISPELLEDVDCFDACETTLHEGRHAYQNDVVRIAESNNYDLSEAIYSDIREWKRNFDNYFTKDDGMNINEYMTYSVQPVERDAEEHGYNLALVITSYINSWE